MQNRCHGQNWCLHQFLVVLFTLTSKNAIKTPIRSCVIILDSGRVIQHLMFVIVCWCWKENHDRRQEVCVVATICFPFPALAEQTYDCVCHMLHVRQSAFRLHLSIQVVTCQPHWFFVWVLIMLCFLHPWQWNLYHKPHPRSVLHVSACLYLVTFFRSLARTTLIDWIQFFLGMPTHHLFKHHWNHQNVVLNFQVWLTDYHGWISCQTSTKISCQTSTKKSKQTNTNCQKHL